MDSEQMRMSSYNVEDPLGYVQFFSVMAQEEGYVTGLSWFRTHPPFYERMAEAFEETIFLPDLKDPTQNSEEFKRIQARLKEIEKEMEEEDREAPTLKRVYDCE